MRAIRLLFCLLVSTAAINAHAAASRTWVATLGDDTNSCSYSAPCKTFAKAYSETATGGMISVLSAGSYGSLTINRSITIDGGGNFASVLASGGDGFTINFLANDGLGNNVVIRGVSFSSSVGGGYGIAVTGTVPTNVHVIDSTFTRMAVAVGMFPGAAGSSLNMDNVEASQLSGLGVVLSPPAAGAAMQVSMKNVRVAQTGSSSYQAGVRALANTNGTISDCRFQNGNHGILIEAASVHLSLVRTVLSENTGSGLHHNVAGITTLLDGCSIFGNGVGVSNVNGTVAGFSNNSIGYNGQDVAGAQIQSVMQQ